MEESLSPKNCFAEISQDSIFNFSESTETRCPSIWDGFTCWAPAVAGTLVTSSCPAIKGSDKTKSSFRTCSKSGEWLNKNGTPSSIGWTNYTLCLSSEIAQALRQLGPDDEAQMKINIAQNTRVLEFIGLSTSLAALIISLLIFYKFRALRNSRTRLHRHLFSAMIIQVGIRLLLYTDQVVTRSHTTSPSSTEINTVEHEGYQRPGIDNMPGVCEATYICLEYARTAMFMWMLAEGIYIHNRIAEQLSPKVYPFIGWILPIPLTFCWATVTYYEYGTTTCWWGYNFTVYFWILEGLRLAILLVNFLFLLNILKVLVMKLRESSSTDVQQALKALKATLTLLPLLGLTNLLNMITGPLDRSVFVFAVWSYVTHSLNCCAKTDSSETFWKFKSCDY